METHLFVRGIVMGLALAIPVGPICVLCIHRAMAGGWLAAFLSTLGAVVGDCILGAMAGLGSSVIAPFVEHEEAPLRIFGGLFLVTMGALSFRATFTLEPEARRSGLVREFASSFLITTVNPVNILGVLGVFAAVGTFKVGELEAIESLALLILGLACGSAVWWLFLSGAADFVGRRFPKRGLTLFNRSAASLLALFGFAILYVGVTAAIRRYFS